jgi:hypothetical protein
MHDGAVQRGRRRMGNHLALNRLMCERAARGWAAHRGDAVVHGLGSDLHGPEEFKSFHAAYREACPDVKIRVDDMHRKDCGREAP